jgi:ELWxxDGT repeat protein
MFRTDGTAAGTHLITTIAASVPWDGAEHGGALYFGAITQSFIELWRTDGTPGGTYRLSNWVDHGSLSGLPLSCRGEIFFATSWQGTGSLWRVATPPSPPELVKHFAESAISTCFVHGDELYLLGAALWRTDGTAGRTDQVKIQFKDSPGTAPGPVVAAFDGKVLIADRNLNLWTLNLDAARSTTGGGGCAAAGAAPGWPALALACLLMPLALRRRELFAWQGAGAHTLPAGERRPAPRELP